MAHLHQVLAAEGSLLAGFDFLLVVLVALEVGRVRVVSDLRVKPHREALLDPAVLRHVPLRELNAHPAHRLGLQIGQCFLLAAAQHVGADSPREPILMTRVERIIGHDLEAFKRGLGPGRRVEQVEQPPQILRAVYQRRARKQEQMRRMPRDSLEGIGSQCARRERVVALVGDHDSGAHSEQRGDMVAHEIPCRDDDAGPPVRWDCATHLVQSVDWDTW